MSTTTICDGCGHPIKDTKGIQVQVRAINYSAQGDACGKPCIAKSIQVLTAKLIEENFDK